MPNTGVQIIPLSTILADADSYPEIENGWSISRLSLALNTHGIYFDDLPLINPENGGEIVHLQDPDRKDEDVFTFLADIDMDLLKVKGVLEIDRKGNLTAYDLDVDFDRSTMDYAAFVILKNVLPVLKANNLPLKAVIKAFINARKELGS